MAWHAFKAEVQCLSHDGSFTVLWSVMLTISDWSSRLILTMSFDVCIMHGAATSLDIFQ
jgi:hypothetical protein